MSAAYGIASSDVHRNQATRGPVVKLVTYIAASTVAGAAMGGALGALGSVVPIDSRIVLAVVLAPAAAVLGALELAGRMMPFQCDRETPQRWVHLGPLRWATVNGAVLGRGATSRLGFWLWYVVPLGAFLFGHALVGAVVYASFSAVRAFSAGFILLAWRITGDADRVADWLFRRAGLARRIAAGQLMLTGLAMSIMIGA
jgi:hypothetical protein